MRQIDLLEELYLNENIRADLSKKLIQKYKKDGTYEEKIKLGKKNANSWWFQGLIKGAQHTEAIPQYNNYKKLSGNLTYEEYRSKLRSKDLKNHFGGRTIKKTDYPEINKYLASKYHD
jgi:hypothetical protein